MHCGDKDQKVIGLDQSISETLIKGMKLGLLNEIKLLTPD